MQCTHPQLPTLLSTDMQHTSSVLPSHAFCFHSVILQRLFFGGSWRYPRLPEGALTWESLEHCSHGPFLGSWLSSWHCWDYHHDVVCSSARYSLTLFSNQESFANNNKRGWMGWYGMINQDFQRWARNPDCWAPKSPHKHLTGHILSCTERGNFLQPSALNWISQQ